MHESPQPPTGATARLTWPFAPWYMPLWAAYLFMSWWEVARRTLAAAIEEVESASGGHTASLLMTATTVLSRFLGFGVEAAFYWLWWRGRRVRLPYWRFAAVVMTLSTFDLLGESLGRGADARTGPWLIGTAAVSGIGVLRKSWPGVDHGLWAGFGSLGLLTVGRIALTARAQSLGTGRRLLESVALTAGTWVATRTLIWWTTDLFRGRSPLP